MMTELRLFVDEWDCYADGMITKKVSDPVLQYRQMQNISEIGIQEPIWSEWQDVPTVYGDKDER